MSNIVNLLREALCNGSLHGRPVDKRVRVLAALNPYRRPCIYVLHYMYM